MICGVWFIIFFSNGSSLSLEIMNFRQGKHTTSSEDHVFLFLLNMQRIN